MFAALSHPYDDDKVVEVYLVEHATKSKEKFECEWVEVRNKILDSALESDPEDNITDIIKTMNSNGWQIIRTIPAKITY
jgi:hypothetical protein